MSHDLRGSGPLSSRFVDAIASAAEIHHAQRRKGTNVAYVSHLMSVSALVLEDGGSEDEAIAGLLHDAVEDGPATARATIAERFGDEILSMVLACTDDEPGPSGVKRAWRVRKEAYVAHLAVAPLGALRVTGADKLHNARCTADDLRIDGAWPVSNACVHQHLWYYASVAGEVSRRLPESRIAMGLDRTVDELCQLVGVPRPVTSRQVPDCSSCEGSAP